MTKTIERYQRYCFNPQDNSVECDTQNWSEEVSKLRAKHETLQRTQRNLLGEDLGPLSVKELQNLEKQLEGALAQTRRRKTQIMTEHMEELKIKERQLGDINAQLTNKLQTEKQGLSPLPCIWNSTSTAAANSCFALPPARSNPMGCDNEPILQIGYNYVHGESSVPRSMAAENYNNFFQGWMP